ncbi:MAG: methyltransferase domain-containing protein [Xanthobacteraceae bacterium]
MQEAYRRDFSHLTWDQVYTRQVQRSVLAADWMDALTLKAGDRVLDVGPGPGFVSLLMAGRVGAEGLVYAIDPAAEALAYLARLQNERGIRNIQTFAADAATVELPGVTVDAALIAMVLHHADDPAGILRNVARLTKPEGLTVIAEFDPDGPCEHGPPRQHRLAPRQVQAWCEAAGWSPRAERRQSPEHYMVLAQRTA